MSLPLVQPDSGFVPSDELKELVSLTEVLGATSFISTSGRVYRLFGNEEKALVIPDIPAIPPILAAQKLSSFSLEDALQQIETFALPETSENVSKQPQPSLTVQAAEYVCPPATLMATPPALQLFHALGEPATPDRHACRGIPLKLIKDECSVPNEAQNAVPSVVALSVKDVIHEISQVLPTAAPAPLPKPNEEKRKPLRVVSGLIEEPFIVPFAKPESPSQETETKNTALKIASEWLPPPKIRNIQCYPKVLRTCGQHRRSERTLYRKRLSVPPVSVSPVSVIPMAGFPTAHEQKPPVDLSAFQWSEQLNSLMQTASNQIRMLTDHLVVQRNQGIKAICFKSVFPEDGCSTILLCAVRALMKRNYRILLVDTHHRHIDLPKQLNLSGNLETENEVIRVNDHLGLWVWQESKTVEENMELITDVITVHRDQYDLILLDDGSVTESPLMAFVAFWNRVELDGVVLVSNTKRPTEMPLSHIASRLRQHHIPLIGIAENYV